MKRPRRHLLKPRCPGRTICSGPLALGTVFLAVAATASYSACEPRSRAEKNSGTISPGTPAVATAAPKKRTVAPWPAGPDNSTGDFVLPGPTRQGWAALTNGPRQAERFEKVRGTKDYPLVALARYFKTDIFTSISSSPKERGYLRRGARVRAQEQVFGKGCKGGKWYPVEGGGYVCTALGVTVSEDPGELNLHFSHPDVASPLPFEYRKVKDRNVPRFYSIPSVAEGKAIPRVITAAKWPEVVEKPMDGVFFLAIHDLVRDHQRPFYRTVYGRFVRQADTQPPKSSTMHGELLGKNHTLPMAFVFGEARAAYRLVDGEPQKIGMAAKHARFSVQRVFDHQGQTWVEGPNGVLLTRNAVRVLEKLSRPEDVPAGEKWIHVNLPEQALVAYQGDTPVFATVISSGKEGHEPPTGLFRIFMKHVSVTMNGEDPVDKWYEVEEVPWTMYYWEGFAIHGAYWHNDFGVVRSHGCTNVAPPDARWLFYWSSPEVPKGWQGFRENGTWVKFTK